MELRHQYILKILRGFYYTDKIENSYSKLTLPLALSQFSCPYFSFMVINIISLILSIYPISFHVESNTRLLIFINNMKLVNKEWRRKSGLSLEKNSFIHLCMHHSFIFSSTPCFGDKNYPYVW